MTHQEYRERLDEILQTLNGQRHKIPKAKQAIDRLFLDAVGGLESFVDSPARPIADYAALHRNQLRQQLRTTITGKEGGE